MKDEDGIISSGTAFFYENNDASFVLTNWHNVSGLDPHTGAHLDPKQRRPTKLILKLSTWITVEEPRHFQIQPIEIEIYSDCRQRTLWYEHPELGKDCDLVAIPCAKPENTPPFMHNFSNRISHAKIPVKPGCPVFIIGFPMALSSGFGLPIWKSGFIASEPHYNVVIGGQLSEYGGMVGGHKIPAFFVDSLTRSGMSGSPVFASYTGNWDMTAPYQKLNPDSEEFWNRDDVALGENRLEFVGIYSGRVPTNEGEAALGLCWNLEAINSVCSARVSGKHPHIPSD